MKKIITYASLFLITAILLTSCGNSKSFKQRHYNNKYYIGISKSKSIDLSENKEVEQDEKVGSTSSINLIEEKIEKEENFIDHNDILIESDIETNIVEEEKSGKKIAPFSINSSKQENTKSNLYSLAKLKQTIGQKKQKSNYNSRGDALSLLWIVIIILIILWAIGFAFGSASMGGLIHLLLLIALILLILWLLRVI